MGQAFPCTAHSSHSKIEEVERVQSTSGQELADDQLLNCQPSPSRSSLVNVCSMALEEIARLTCRACHDWHFAKDQPRDLAVSLPCLVFECTCWRVVEATIGQAVFGASRAVARPGV
eukprot:4708483-Amphidinium_carterae.1